jgi:hypothetical protein
LLSQVVLTFIFYSITGSVVFTNEICGKIKMRFIGFHGKLSREHWYSLELLYPLNVDMKLSYLSLAVYPLVVTNQPDQRLREIHGKIKTRFIGFQENCHVKTGIVWNFCIH